MERNPTLAEVMNESIERAFEGLYVWTPARVVAYDATRQLADVQPLVKVRHYDEDGQAVVQSIPVVPSVPVMFPGGGLFAIMFPIEVGDTVAVLFSGVSLDKWKTSSGGAPVDPEIHARHTLADAVVVPGLRSFRQARSSAPTDHVRLGTDGATAQGVALGEALAKYVNGLTGVPSTDPTCLVGFLHALAVAVNGLAPGSVPLGGPTSPDLLVSATVKVTQ